MKMNLIKLCSGVREEVESKFKEPIFYFCFEEEIQILLKYNYFSNLKIQIKWPVVQTSGHISPFLSDNCWLNYCDGTHLHIVCMCRQVKQMHPNISLIQSDSVGSQAFYMRVVCSCTHHYDAGTDEEPTCSPPQPETETLRAEHHLHVFDKTVSSWIYEKNMHMYTAGV